MTDATFTCAGCGLLCDDVRVSADGVLQPDCTLGTEWFTAQRAADPAATIGGEPVALQTALARAAELLAAARRPLIYGFEHSTVEAARAAVTLADRLGALVRVGPASVTWPGGSALALRGSTSATLGEVRDRSELVVIWGEDPETTHPRLLDRLGFSQRSQRVLVVVDDRETATARRADLWLRWPREGDLETLSKLHVLHRHGEESQLLERVYATQHASFIYGSRLSSGAGGERRLLALNELIRSLSRERHVVTFGLSTAAGVRGAQDVLSWQTGYPQDVDLASGHPVPAAVDPDDGVDVALCVQGAATGPPAGATGIALGDRPSERFEVSIRTPAAGIGAGGTLHRLAGVPLTLQTPRPSDAPGAAELLNRLRNSI